MSPIEASLWTAVYVISTVPVALILLPLVWRVMMPTAPSVSHVVREFLSGEFIRAAFRLASFTGGWIVGNREFVRADLILLTCADCLVFVAAWLRPPPRDEPGECTDPRHRAHP